MERTGKCHSRGGRTALDDKEFVLDTLRCAGQAVAKAVQEQAAAIIGTELNAASYYIPDFQAA